MKTCPYCGKEYSDELEICVLDHTPLELIVSISPEKILDPEPGFQIPKTLKLGIDVRDNGLSLIWKCPRCLLTTNFNAIVSRGNLKVIGLEVSTPVTMLDLRCESCKYELRIDASERELLERLRGVTYLFTDGNISSEEYKKQVLGIPARFIKDLTALTQNWKCPTCGEENPVTFDTCWNCSSRNTDPANDISEDATPFPGMPKGGNSWEQ